MPVHKQLKLGRIGVDVSHAKIPAKDWEECTGLERSGSGSGSGRINRFERVISIDAEVSEELRGKIAEIVDKCPVHRTLDAVAKFATTLKPGSH